MFAKSFLLFAAATLSLASPLHTRAKSSCSTPVLPVNGGGKSPYISQPLLQVYILTHTIAKELAAPPAGTTLKFIGLGLGIQNYTCADIGASAAATGALAMLYDVTSLYPGQSRKSLSQEAFDALTSTALRTHDIPLNFNSSTDDRVEPSSPGASLTDPFTADAPLQLDGLDPIPFLGHHFFNSGGVPQFVLDSGAVNYLGRKDDNISAPSTADPGPQNTGAVDWLQLGAQDGSVGAVELYRVLTAGGDSHGCASAAGGDSTTYSALYWFYA